MTDVAIVESRADRASLHICEALRKIATWTEREDDTRPDGDGGGAWWSTADFELRSFDALHLELERPVEAFDGDPAFLVFASRHAGDTGPLLTGHFTGNFGPAEFGGADGELAVACPNALARLLDAFDEHAPDEYDVGMECTHHGPTDVGCPSLFAELGSDESQWNDPEGAEAVARAILDLRGVAPHREPLESETLASHRTHQTVPRRQLVGFGGGHYVPRFERIVRETPWAVGHVGAEWALEAMGEPRSAGAVLETAFESSEARVAVVDGDRPSLEAQIEELGYDVVSETWVREVGDRPQSLVERVESELGPVDDGIRFGDVRVESFDVVSLPDELVATATGIDSERSWTAVAERAVAFETENGGTRLGDRVALPADDGTSPEIEPDDANEPDESHEQVQVHLTEIVERLADVLRERYDAVRVEPTAVVAEEVAFDPQRAGELGVPEGPKFGALAGGEAVTVDGDLIEPDDVHVERVDRFLR